jgi:hypothetical protein
MVESVESEELAQAAYKLPIDLHALDVLATPTLEFQSFVDCLDFLEECDKW